MAVLKVYSRTANARVFARDLPQHDQHVAQQEYEPG